ncbi:MAG TPA: hypothetical protein VGW38_23895, partial [Chloroflexota bacterium]|nr:hypothetical protein [Chloroflexota bacterium]
MMSARQRESVGRVERVSATFLDRVNRGLRLVGPALITASLLGAGVAGAQGFGQNFLGQFEPGFNQPGFTQNAPGYIEPGVNRPGFTPNRPGVIEPGFNRPGNFGAAGGLGTGANLAGLRVVDATVDEILDRPRAFVGQWVAVTGEIGDRIGRRGFTLEDSDVFFDDDLLVLGANRVGAIPGFDNAFASGDLRAQVVGVVRQFDPMSIRNEFGLDFEQGLFNEFEGRPVIVAAAVNIGNGFVPFTPNLLQGGVLGVDRGLGAGVA